MGSPTFYHFTIFFLLTFYLLVYLFGKWKPNDHVQKSLTRGGALWNNLDMNFKLSKPESKTLKLAVEPGTQSDPSPPLNWPEKV